MAQFSQHHYNKLAKVFGVTYRELTDESISILAARRVERKVIETLKEDNEHFDDAHFRRVIRETQTRGY